MSKSARIAALAAALGIAYPAAAWLLGKQVETALDLQYERLAEQPYLKVVERRFERGVFHSTEVATFELNGELLAALAAGSDDAAEVAVPTESLRFTLRTEIDHGPLPGLRTAAAATAETALLFDDAVKAQLATVFGDAAPVQIKTVYGFGGGGSSTFSSPAFKTVVPGTDGGERRISWQGLTFKVDFTRNMQRYTMQGEAPGLEVEDDASHLVVGAMHIAGEQARVFEDESMLYAGSQKVAIDELRMTPRAGSAAGGEGGAVSEALLLKQVVYDVNSPAKGDFIDISVKLGAETVQLGQRNYGPAHYDLSLSHLHARTLARLSREAMSLYSEESLRQAREGQAAFAMAALAEPARELLAHDPEISIDRISFRSPHGDATLALRVRANQLKPDDLQNPFALIGKLEVSGSAALPEGLLTELQRDEAQPPEEAARQIERQLATYAAQGLVLREQGVVKTALEFRGGELKINGKAVNPFALGAAAGGDEVPAQPGGAPSMH